MKWTSESRNAGHKGTRRQFAGLGLLQAQAKPPYVIATETMI